MTYEPSKYERYIHHGIEVGVRSDLLGKHRDYCLCYKCKWFKPSCQRAEAIFAFDKKYHIVTPVFECPDFKEEREA
ncbi:hypothetical protein [Dehalococcoides sp. THU4]|uniref:hypothetical protein n=1 Tax=Dehalococcoides sp. THU4 TaxID=3348344 RepID=UPI00371CF8A5